jgi:diguanylate cyclase
MKNKPLYDKIFAIHDQTIDRMQSLRIPPYPTHYKKHFDEFFIQHADAELKKVHAQEQEHLDDPHTELARYLDIAQRSIMAFVETHTDISHVADLQQQYIDNMPKNGVERCVNLVEGLSNLGKNMSDELKKAQQKIEVLSTELKEAIAVLTTDPLTQVGNRKGFMEDLEMSLDAGQTKQLPLVLIMIDADNFKLLNDEYGHIAGDKVLYFLAQSIKSIMRSGDKVYRFGGEEFAVVLNRCSSEQAFGVADKIRSKIEHSHLIYAGKTIHVTVSVGVTVHRRGDTFEDLITRADQALYQAKKARKNCTIVFDS